MYTKFVASLEAYGQTRKEPLSRFIQAMLEKGWGRAKQEFPTMRIWLGFGIVSLALALSLRDPNIFLALPIVEAISLWLIAYLLFAGMLLGLVSFLVPACFFATIRRISEVILNGAYHGASLMVGMALGFLGMGAVANFAKPEGFVSTFLLVGAVGFEAMFLACLSLGCLQVYDPHNATLEHKVWAMGVSFLFAFIVYFILTTS